MMSAEHQPAHAQEQHSEPDLRIDSHEVARALPWYYRIAVTPVPLTSSHAVMAFWIFNQIGLHLIMPKTRLGMAVSGAIWTWFAVAICHCVYFAGLIVAFTLWNIWNHQRDQQPVA